MPVDNRQQSRPLPLPRRGRARLRRPALAVLAAIAALAASGLFSAQALASAPFAWSSQTLIDSQAPYGATVELTGVSCPSATLCVAVDDVGKVLTSTDGGASWTPARVDANNFLD